MEVVVLEALVSVVPCVALAAGGEQPPEGPPSEGMGAKTTNGRSQEGPAVCVPDRVLVIFPESEERIPVSVQHHAQAYFLHRSDAGIEDRLRVLRE
jgi:hypothetical protein